MSHSTLSHCMFTCLKDQQLLSPFQITDRQLVWTTVEFFLLGIVCIVCLRRGGSPSIHPDVRHLLEMMPSHPNHTASVRRNSVGAVGSVLSTTPMRKQASESALGQYCLTFIDVCVG